jgi:membrane protein implicated in regulation of membrane protease activity
MIYLFAAILWVAFGVFILVYQAVHPDTRLFYSGLAGLNFSLGWVALFFGGYCFLRWWLYRSSRRQMQARYELEQKREEARLRRRREEMGERPPPDPALDFSAKPLPPPLPEEKPPSAPGVG